MAEAGEAFLRVANRDVDEFTTRSRDVLASALGVDWAPGPLAQPIRDENLVRSLRTHIDFVLSRYGDHLEALADRLDDGSTSHITAEWAEGMAHQLANAVFQDDVTNWGRVLTLVAFAKVLGRRLAARGAPRSACALLDGVVGYLARSKRSWILDNGGWYGLCLMVCFIRVLFQGTSMQEEGIRHIKACAMVANLWLFVHGLLFKF
uniref:Bcl-2 Bcl-2 homology region 1-3 domain-containing protein n=1 Tax=Eptatretus burgeri TaxID=7764 RepID=A0A8C4QUZ0_EPTBU